MAKIKIEFDENEAELAAKVVDLIIKERKKAASRAADEDRPPTPR